MSKATAPKYTHMPDGVLRAVLLRGQIGYQAALLSGTQAWDGSTIGELDRLEHARLPMQRPHGGVVLAVRGPEWNEARLAERAAAIRDDLVQSIVAAGLSVSLDGTRATITCREEPHPAAAEVAEREGLQAVARVYSTDPPAERFGVAVYKGTAFGLLDARSGSSPRIMGMHRNVFLVGGCGVPDPSRQAGAPDVAWWWARLQPTLRRAYAVAERVARLRDSAPRRDAIEPELPPEARPEPSAEEVELIRSAFD